MQPREPPVPQGARTPPPTDTPMADASAPDPASTTTTTTTTTSSSSSANAHTIRTSPTTSAAFANRLQLSPVRFATTTNAFGLTPSPAMCASPLSSAESSGRGDGVGPRGYFALGGGEAAGAGIGVGVGGGSGAGAGVASGGGLGVVMPMGMAAGSGIGGHKVRRPSMLSLTQNASFASDGSGDGERTPMANAPRSAGMPLRGSAGAGGERPNGMQGVQDPSSSQAVQLGGPSHPPGQTQANALVTLAPTPRWATGGTFNTALTKRSTSASNIPIGDLKTYTPPIPMETLANRGGSEIDGDADMDGGSEVFASQPSLRWQPHPAGGTGPDLRTSPRKGKARMSSPPYSSSPPHTATPLHGIPPRSRPLPSALLATLISESSPLEHEIQSEARLQRLLLSHPAKLPLTPRAPRGSRGRYPEQVGGDDDDEDDLAFGYASGRRASWTQRDWMGRGRDSDDSDSDNDTLGGAGPGMVFISAEPVNTAFAAGMDMDRPGSSNSSNMWVSANASESRKSTPGGPEREGGSRSSGSAPPTGGAPQQGYPFPPSFATPGGTGPQTFSQGPASGPGVGAGTGFPTPPANNQWPSSALKVSRLNYSGGPSGPGAAGAGAGVAGMVPSPGTGFALPSAFGSLAMGGLGTPLGSPTVERNDLAGSPKATMSSPGLMQYRDGPASIRPGKRKAQVEDRFDPYKRPRGTSPSLLSSLPFPSSPSRTPSTAIPIPASPSHAPLYPSALSTSHPLSSRPRSSHSTQPHQSRTYTRPMASRSRAASPALSVGSAGGLSGSLGSGGRFLGQGERGQGGGAQGGRGEGALGGLGLLSLANQVREEDEGQGEGKVKGKGQNGGRDHGEVGEEDREDRMEED